MKFEKRIGIAVSKDTMRKIQMQSIEKGCLTASFSISLSISEVVSVLGYVFNESVLF